MRKYIFFVFASLLGLGGAVYFYTHSESRLVAEHQEIMNALSRVKQSDTALDKNVLRLQSFQASSYDALVGQEQEIENFCVQLNQPDFVLALNDHIKSSLNKYCDAQMEKLRDIENFKSKNAIYRNSLYYLNTKATEIAILKDHVTAGQELMRKASYKTLIYAAFPSQQAKSLLNERLKSMRNKKWNRKEREEAESILAHINSVLETKSILQTLISEIITDKTTLLLDEARGLIFLKFSEEQKSVNKNRLFLFASSFVFFLCMLFSVFGLWKSARALADVNNHLEERVLLRTQELSEAQKVVLEQQQALMSSSKMSALGEMAGGVAHEINTPLAVIQLYTDQMLDLVKEGEIDKDFLQNALEAIDGTVRRISKIILGLRSFARDGKQDPLSVAPLKNVVEDSLSLCRERFKNHDVAVEVVCEGEPKINCRITEISQVILNLLNNSYDAIEKNSDKWIKVEMFEKNEQVHLCITDSGNGIPEAIRGKIMQPFFTTKEIGKGTGLGLSISRGIIEAHGGTMQIDTECANTKFVIVFPSIKSWEMKNAG